MADVSGKFFSAKKVRTGVSPSSPGVEQGETLPPVNPPGTSLNSVGLTMPSAFEVANSPLTSNGTIAVTGAGTVAQYVRGDGSLADFPESIGSGASVSYYLNGSVNQGTIGGVTYYEMNKTPIIGAGTDFTRNSNGYIASFLTDANDPSLLVIPAGNWNFETYFEASSGGGSPTFYLELYKYDGTTFTLVASNSGSPKLINDGTSIEAYFSALAVPQTTLTLTDRLAIRIYVTTAGRTITLHTENNTLCQVITTFTTGLSALNGLTSQVQFFAVGTSGTNFNIASATDTHTFNLPTASATNRGALASADWSTFNNKQNQLNGTGFVKANGTTISYDNSTYQVTSEKGQPNGYASLDGNGKVPLAQINDALIGNVNYQGLWNAATNNPTLVNPPSSGTKGYYYIVSTAGTFAGISFEVGDWIISNGSAWQKVDNTDAVSSVFGRTGNVIAANGDYNTSQVTENTNLYYTEARVNANTNVAANTAARHNAVTLGTANGLGLVGQQLSLQLATSGQNGALSSTDWTTFNNKENAITAGTTAQYFRGDKTFQTLNTSVVPELTNLYYTEARVNANTNVAANTAARHAAVTLGITNGLGLTGQQLSLGLASAGVTGALSGTDWSTFNGKANANGNNATGTWGISITGDAGSVDGIDSSRIVYGGLGSRQGVNLITDWNQSLFPDAAFLSSESSTTNAPSTDFSYGVQTSFHRSGPDYRTQFVTSLYGNNVYWLRQLRDSAGWSSWVQILHSGNFNSYAPTLLGVGASGTWSIAISGNAATANNWTTARTLTIGATGKSVDGSSNVAWSLSEIGAYAASNPSAFIALTALSGTAPIEYNNTTGAISITQASGSTNGFLSSTDWNTFNNKTSNVGTVTSVAALTLGTSGTDLSSTVANGTTTPVITLNVPTASATNRGALSAADWTAFNSKQQALNGTGFVKISGTTISYDNSTYLIGNQTITLSGDATGSGATAITVVLANSGVTAGTYNDSATQVRPFTVDAKGRITSIGTAVTITPDWANISGQRTLTRDDAGLQGNAGARSGFFETVSPVNYYSGANSWQHLIESRHTNDSNNYAMQIAGSFFDQEFYVRKTNNSATTAWSKLWHSGNLTPVTGTGTSGQVAYWSSGSAITGESNLFWDATNDRLGISQPGPGAKLDIVSTGTGSEGLRVDGAGGGFAFVVKGGTDYSTHIRAGATIGASYFTTPPVNGLIVQGNVGIGTTNPVVALDLGGATGKSIHLYSSAGDFYGINMLNYDSGPFSTNIFAGDGGQIKFRTASGTSTQSTRMTISALGNVGIGTDSPATRLQIDGTGYSFITGSDAGNRRVYIGLDSTGEPSIQGALSNGTARQISINPAGGNVGIGTASPSTILDVFANTDIWHTFIGGSTSKLLIGGQAGSGGVVLQAGNSSTPNNAVPTTTYRLMLQRDGGNVLIGTATDTGGARRLQVAGDVFVDDNTTTGNGVQLKNADRPLITRGWDAFTSGNKTGVGRWGVYMESAELFLGSPGTDYTNGLVTIGGWLANGTRQPNLTVNNQTRNVTAFGSITATSFFESSDAKLKTLVQDAYQAKGIESVIAKLYIKNGKQELGYFAQDLENILPSAVSKGTDGLLNLSYREVHTAKIAYLEQKIKQLENELGRFSK